MKYSTLLSFGGVHEEQGYVRFGRSHKPNTPDSLSGTICITTQMWNRLGQPDYISIDISQAKVSINDSDALDEHLPFND